MRFTLPSHVGSAAQHEKQLPGDAAPEDLRGQIAALFGAQWTHGDDPAVGHRFDGSGDVLAAPLATKGEIADTGCGRVKHADSIGE